jgi:hypothetical protein
MNGSSTTLDKERPASLTTLARRRPAWLNAVAMIVLIVLLAGGGIALRRLGSGTGDNPHRTFPQSTAMQDKLGVRFSRVAVVADGGLITLSYVVLDPEKASRFQAGTAHPPKLTSESRKLSTTRVSLMKQGHVLNPGQTYYLVYENTRDALRPGERVTITYGSLRLQHAPVL